MIDNFSLALTHGLMLLAAFLLLGRRDLDHESEDTGPSMRRKRDRGGDAPGA